MQMRRRAITGTISILILLSLFFILINVICNGHIHRIADGTILFHAHPYQKNGQNEPVKNHHHTRFELFFYDLITHLFDYSLSNLIFWIFIFTVIVFRSFHFFNIPSNKFVLIPLVRALPIKFTKDNISLQFI